MTPLHYDDLRRLMSAMTGDEKHDASATSTLDVLWVLYDRVLRVDPRSPDHPDRDRFYLSKGHGPMAYYAVLAAHGFLDPDELPGFGRFGSHLGYHPDRNLLTGVEISSGSLGHGLPLAVGTALALRAQGREEPRVVVLVGDAELEEGSNHEAIQFAGRAGLSRLTTVVIDNRSSSGGWPGGIAARFTQEGWSGVDADGRDHDAIEGALCSGAADRPHAVVAHIDPKEAA
jgi:transketolase